MSSTASSPRRKISRDLLTAGLVGIIALMSGCDRFVPASPRPPAKGPLRVHASNPRYLDDGSGKAIVLVGSHTWTNLQDAGPADPPPTLDFDAYLQMLADHNHNFIRLWRLEPAEYVYPEYPREFVAPHPWRRTGPGVAIDGKPKFDLSQLDEEHFQRLRGRVERAGLRGMYVAVMLFEGHALAHAQEAWYSHPFNGANNVNGVDSDRNGDGRGLESHTLDDAETLRHQEAYVRRVIETVHDLDNVLFEICNESHPESDAWQRHMIGCAQSALRDLNSERLIIYSTTLGGSNETLWDSSAEIISLGKEWVGDRIPLRENPPPSTGEKVVMLDTDHLWGCGGEADWVFKAFTRGYHPIYMDPWQAGGACGKPDQQMRRNLGTVLRFADRMNLAEMAPRPELASSGYCLANPEREYLVYSPVTGEVQVDLEGADAKLDFAVEWFDPRRLRMVEGPTIRGGAKHTLNSPLKGPGLLYVHAQELRSK